MTSNSDRRQPLSLDQATHAAFLSFSTRDDDAYFGWITHFYEELGVALPARAGTERRLPIFHTGVRPLVAGDVGVGLREAAHQSFALVIFVHHGYVLSPYCLAELTAFRDRFGDRGLNERLYVIAMSESAIRQLEARAEWAPILQLGRHVWIRFFQEDDTDEPVVMRMAGRSGKYSLDSAFTRPFTAFLNHLAKQIRDDIDRTSSPPQYPDFTTPSPIPQTEVSTAVGSANVYIESDSAQSPFWNAIAAEIGRAWDQLALELDEEPAMRLRPTGLDLSTLEGRPALSDANGAVLLWVKKQPQTLIAEIARLEPKLAGSDCAPGLVIYLMENARDRPPQRRIRNWEVVCMLARPDDKSVTLLPEDQQRLAKFVTYVHHHKRLGGT